MKQPYIVSIQKFSIHDGEGIRTTVFFKGCQLKCWWCHNPETQKYGRQLLFDQKKCTGCGYCKKACKKGAITISKEGIAQTDMDKCILCEECLDYCLANNREIVGTQYEISELVKILEKDRTFYEESGGGVTLSGGEVMTQDIDYLVELCQHLKAKNLSIAIDTCGFAPQENFERILPYADVFLYDIKTLDDEKHKKYIGQSNKLILSNLKFLTEQKANINIRIPVVGTFNDDEKSMLDLIRYLKETTGIVKVNLLPYHNTGSSKYDKLGIEYPAKDLQIPSREHMEKLKQLFEENGFTQLKIGG